jgi:hypothetical protein
MVVQDYQKRILLASRFLLSNFRFELSLNAVNQLLFLMFFLPEHSCDRADSAPKKGKAPTHRCDNRGSI